jgi:SAM-dependent methyltransferase
VTEFFSDHAADYARHRPRYPAALFEYLASLAPRKNLAWDCATGNGQAAEGLEPYFERVVASDKGMQQVAQARPSRVIYLGSTAEAAPLRAASVDLLTAAQAVHWFDFELFYAEAGRVLAPSAAIVVSTYSLLRVDPAVDRVISYLYHEVVGSYWPPERRWVEDEYRSLPFPFAEEAPPPFVMEQRWNLDETAGYLSTWSACRRLSAVTGQDPVRLVAAELEEAWGPPEVRRRVSWPLHLRVGRNI